MYYWGFDGCLNMHWRPQYSGGLNTGGLNRGPQHPEALNTGGLKE